MPKTNSIIVLLYILILKNRGEAFSHSFSKENTSRGLVTRQAFNLLINAISESISAADVALSCQVHKLL